MHLFQHPLYSQHLWAWWHFGNHLVDIILERMQLSQYPLIHSTSSHDDILMIMPVLLIYLSTTSTVFIPTGHFNIYNKGSSIWLYFRFHLFPVCGLPGRQSLLYSRFFFFFLLIITRSGLLAEIRWSFCIKKEFYDPHFLRQILVCAYNICKYDQIQSLAKFTQSCYVVFSFCANLLHSLTIGWNVSSFSPHNLYLLFCCVYHYYITPSELLSPVLADGLSQVSEWQQASLRLQDSSQYFGWS